MSMLIKQIHLIIFISFDNILYFTHITISSIYIQDIYIEHIVVWIEIVKLFYTGFYIIISYGNHNEWLLCYWGSKFYYFSWVKEDSLISEVIDFIIIQYHSC